MPKSLPNSSPSSIVCGSFLKRVSGSRSPTTPPIAEMIPITTSGRTSISEPCSEKLQMTASRLRNCGKDSHQIIDERDNGQTETTQISGETDADTAHFCRVQFPSERVQYEETRCNCEFRNEVQYQSLVDGIFMVRKRGPLVCCR